ncbi:MAG: hypothetical protein CR961_01810 [Polaribacter sp.]|nr:MAG: hypothetical protein CR961_01810 [Polaribacter sp.]
MSKTTNATTKKVESESIFEKKSDNLYQRTTKFKNSDFNKDDYIKRLYHFDKNNRVIKKEDVGQIRNFEIKENAQIFYSKNHYDYVIFENKI